MASTQTQQIEQTYRIQCVITRPPKAQALPLNSRNVGMSRWQLYYETTLTSWAGEHKAARGDSIVLN
jgi:hypothetical protein